MLSNCYWVNESFHSFCSCHIMIELQCRNRIQHVIDAFVKVREYTFSSSHPPAILDWCLAQSRCSIYLLNEGWLKLSFNFSKYLGIQLPTSFYVKELSNCSHNCPAIKSSLSCRMADLKPLCLWELFTYWPFMKGNQSPEAGIFWVVHAFNKSTVLIWHLNQNSQGGLFLL